MGEQASQGASIIGALRAACIPRQIERLDRVLERLLQLFEPVVAVFEQVLRVAIAAERLVAEVERKSVALDVVGRRLVLSSTQIERRARLVAYKIARVNLLAQIWLCVQVKAFDGLLGRVAVLRHIVFDVVKQEDPKAQQKGIVLDLRRLRERLIQQPHLWWGWFVDKTASLVVGACEQEVAECRQQVGFDNLYFVWLVRCACGGLRVHVAYQVVERVGEGERLLGLRKEFAAPEGVEVDAEPLQIVAAFARVLDVVEHWGELVDELLMLGAARLDDEWHRSCRQPHATQQHQVDKHLENLTRGRFMFVCVCVLLLLKEL